MVKPSSNANLIHLLSPLTPIKMIYDEYYNFISNPILKCFQKYVNQTIMEIFWTQYMNNIFSKWNVDMKELWILNHKWSCLCFTFEHKILLLIIVQCAYITTLSNIIKQGIIRFKTLSNSNHILNNYSEKFSQYVSFQGISRLKCKIVSYCSLYSTELDAINVF